MEITKKYKLFYALMNVNFLGGIIVIYYLAKGLTYAQIGIATAISTIGFFLFEVPTGVIGDKVSRKKSVLIGLALFPMGTIILLFLKNFPMLIAYSVITSISVTFISGSLQAWLYDNLKYLGREREYRKLMKDIKTITLPLSAVTVVIGSFLAQYYGFRLPLILKLILEIMMIIVAISIPEYEFKKPKVAYHIHVLHSLKELMKPNIFWLIVVAITVAMSINQFRQYFEPYLGNILAQNLKTTIMGTLGILGLVEALVKAIPRLVGVRLKEKWSAFAYSIAPVSIPILTALSVIYRNPIFIVVLGTIATIINTAFSFNFGIELQTRIPSEKRATIISLYSMVSALVMAFFYGIYGFAVNRIGLAEARLMFALALFAVGLAFKGAQVLGILKEPLELKHLSGN
ncbi:MFS transporter permease [Thermococcus chitonophagus]|uniref:MFS transporter permease n=1 Tax=Thermococcus chitonophagus TaxID=54262 RepID=A0A160VS80_9EURY|nr:MFS transporter [Thermococcus chitonophagus]ASJ17228.1 MFS transporter permease [Thermococcus chitonophagus]CUX77845.1 putative sugar transporter [Thermococcus chitonophagus]